MVRDMRGLAILPLERLMRQQRLVAPLSMHWCQISMRRSHCHLPSPESCDESMTMIRWCAAAATGSHLCFRAKAFVTRKTGTASAHQTKQMPECRLVREEVALEQTCGAWSRLPLAFQAGEGGKCSFVIRALEMMQVILKQPRPPAPHFSSDSWAFPRYLPNTSTNLAA